MWQTTSQEVVSGVRFGPWSILSIGPCSFLPSCSSAGVTPMVYLRAEFMVNLISGKNWSHFLWLSSTYNAIIFLRVLFTRSVMFVWRWYDVVNFGVPLHFNILLWTQMRRTGCLYQKEWSLELPKELRFIFLELLQYFVWWHDAWVKIQLIVNNQRKPASTHFAVFPG